MNVPHKEQKKIDEFHETAETIPQISLNAKGCQPFTSETKTNNVHTLWNF